MNPKPRKPLMKVEIALLKQKLAERDQTIEHLRKRVAELQAQLRDHGKPAALETGR